MSNQAKIHMIELQIKRLQEELDGENARHSKMIKLREEIRDEIILLDGLKKEYQVGEETKLGIRIQNSEEKIADLKEKLEKLGKLQKKELELEKNTENKETEKDQKDKQTMPTGVTPEELSEEEEKQKAEFKSSNDLGFENVSSYFAKQVEEFKIHKKLVKTCQILKIHLDLTTYNRIRNHFSNRENN